MTWDEWRGSLDGRQTMWIKRMIRIPFWRTHGKTLSVRVDLHKFVRADDEGCFHTHPAWAVRIVLWGGYVEQICTLDGIAWCYWRRPGHVGIVTPTLCHRVDEILNGRASYSLWIRGPVCADVELRGPGWPKQ